MFCGFLTLYLDRTRSDKIQETDLTRPKQGSKKSYKNELFHINYLFFGSLLIDLRDKENLHFYACVESNIRSDTG